MNARMAFGLWVLCWGLLAQYAGAQDKTIRLFGEVAQGLTYRKSIGRGLDFVLSPDSMGGSITGWTIQVTPHGKPPDPDCTDYLWVITPPFRFWNHRYLSTEYGNTAQEAVGFSPRDFNFVLNCADYKTERQRVDRVLWPYTYSKEDVDDSLAKPMPPHGTGRLWIKDSKYTPGDKSANPVTLGEIHWIKFEVEIRFPEESKREKKQEQPAP
jgi:hypothetical protein